MNHSSGLESDRACSRRLRRLKSVAFHPSGTFAYFMGRSFQLSDLSTARRSAAAIRFESSTSRNLWANFNLEKGFCKKATSLGRTNLSPSAPSEYPDMYRT